MTLAFRPLAEDDLPLVERWLGEEHVARWWREPIDGEIAGFRAGIEGRDPAAHYLVLLDGKPIGMVQTYLAAEHPEWEEEIGALGPGAAGMDILIGEAAAVGQGLGGRILEAFAKKIVFADPRVASVVATVEEPNRRSWRAFEKAGFRHVGDVEEDGLPHRLMRLERDQVPRAGE
jgi:aminoglycoside 6'-N-acetyltransferase